MKSDTAKRWRFVFSLSEVNAICASITQVCALVDDLEVLEDGDESEVGERGVRLLCHKYW